MMPPSFGNLANTLTLRQANVAAKTSLSTLVSELTTGISNDIPAHLAGDTSRLGHVEARLRIVAAHGRSATEAADRANQMQIVLDNMQSGARLTATGLLAAASTATGQSIAAATSQAKEQLSSAINQLNSKIAGQYIFSGTRVDTPPLVGADDLIDAVHAAIGAPTDIDAVIAAVTAFFDAPPGNGGFSDVIYQGSMDASSAAIAADQSISFGTNAASPEIREMLKGMTLLALATEAPYSDSLPVQTRLVEAAGHVLIGADAEIASLRGKIGTVEAMINHAQARNAGENTALQHLRNDLIGIDQYEAASAIAETETRLSAIYSLTAKLSRLSLAAYL